MAVSKDPLRLQPVASAGNLATGQRAGKHATRPNKKGSRAECVPQLFLGSLLRGSQWGGSFYGYRLEFWLFYGYRLIFSSYG